MAVIRYGLRWLLPAIWARDASSEGLVIVLSIVHANYTKHLSTVHCDTDISRLPPLVTHASCCDGFLVASEPSSTPTITIMFSIDQRVTFVNGDESEYL